MLLYSGFRNPISFHLSFVVMSGFIYHHLSASLYVFVILVVIVKNDLGNKIIHVLRISNTLCTQLFSYYHTFF
jgi:hypothetical protein